MLDNGLKTNDMDTALSLTRKVQVFMGFTSRVKRKGQVCYTSLMAATTMVISRIIQFVVSESTIGPMVNIIVANGSITK